MMATVKQLSLKVLLVLLALGIAFGGLIMANVGNQGGGSSGPAVAPTATAAAVRTTALPTPSAVAPVGATATPVPSPTLAPLPTGTNGEFLEGLRMENLTWGWETDFSKNSVPLEEIFNGGVSRDGIPPLYRPKFTTTELADVWLHPQEPVIALEIGGDARAYPLQILIWHEIANDTVGGTPVAVTFCPLCNSAIVFDRQLEGTVYEFGVSGNLFNSDLIMWDHETESWWQQFTGEGIVGEMTGKRLAPIPAPIISWQDFREAYPEGQVLSRITGFDRPYGENPYAGYDNVNSPPFLYYGEDDDRLQPKERVVAITVGAVDAAFPFPALEAEKVINYTVGGLDLAVFFKPGTVSALNRKYIRESRDVGATGVFETVLDGRKLTFRADGEAIVDTETGTVWNILGRATSGPLAGSQLTPIVHADHFWFAWAAFKPETKIYHGIE